MKRVSRSFSLSTIQEGISYSIVWTDVNGTTTTIPCYSNGVAKTVPSGYGSEPWLTAMLYKAEGSSAPTPCEAKSIIMKSYDIDGNPITTHPTKGNSSFFAIEKYYHDHASEAKYEVEFRNDNGDTLAKSAICRTLDGTNGDNGENGYSPAYYFEERYAWSNRQSTSSPTDCPDDLTPNSFVENVPDQNEKAYLWKQIKKYVLESGQYQLNSTKYYRMTGERGTAVSVKGQAAAVVIGRYQGTSNLPSSGMSVGDYAFVTEVVDDHYLYKYEYDGSSNAWMRQDFFFENGDIVIIKNDDQLWRFSIDDITQDQAAQSDGSAYTNLQDGHLWQWSLEARAWLDLGKFKGEDGNNGKTFYTHVAWAIDVWRDTLGDLHVHGFTATKDYTDTSHTWMGVYVDENEGQDEQNADKYTWSYIKGQKGDDGNRGHIGRFYYYGGVFDPNNSTTQFKVNDLEIPFFESHLTQKTYYVYNPTTNPANNQLTMAQMWSNSSQSFNNAPWEAIFNDFKYLITEAIFSNYAHLGSFIINGDWMISQNGTPKAINPQTPAYLDFTLLVDEQGRPTGQYNPNGFVPSLAFNAKTGETWIGNAHINGEVTATSGTFNGEVNASRGTFTGTIVAQQGSVGGFNIVNEELKVGQDAYWADSYSGNMPYALLGKGRIRLYQHDGRRRVHVALGASSYGSTDSDQARSVTIIRSDEVTDQALGINPTPAVEIRHISTAPCMGLRVQSGTSVFQDGIVDLTSFYDWGSTGGVIGLNLLYGNKALIKCTSNVTVTLPTPEQVLSLMYGLQQNIFAVKFSLMTHINNTGTVTVKMQNGDHNAKFVNYRGGQAAAWNEGFTMAASRYVDFMLVYDGANYYAQIVYSSYDMD